MEFAIATFFDNDFLGIVATTTTQYCTPIQTGWRFIAHAIMCACENGQIRTLEFGRNDTEASLTRPL